MQGSDKGVVHYGGHYDSITPTVLRGLLALRDVPGPDRKVTSPSTSREVRDINLVHYNQNERWRVHHGPLAKNANVCRLFAQVWQRVGYWYSPTLFASLLWLDDLSSEQGGGHIEQTSRFVKNCWKWTSRKSYWVHSCNYPSPGYWTWKGRKEESPLKEIERKVPWWIFF